MPKPRKPPAAARIASSSASGDAGSSTSREPVKVSNLYDAASLKMTLDESAREYVTEDGFQEDTTISNIKLILGVSAIACALYAQFGAGKFPQNWWTVFYCVAAYVVLTIVLNVYSHQVEGDSFLVCKPRRSTSLGLRLSSHMERYSDQYTLIMSFGQRGQAGYREEKWSCSVTSFFHEDGFLAEEAFKQKVAELLQQLESNSKKSQ